MLTCAYLENFVLSSVLVLALIMVFSFVVCIDY